MRSPCITRARRLHTPNHLFVGSVNEVLEPYSRWAVFHPVEGSLRKGRGAEPFNGSDPGPIHMVAPIDRVHVPVEDRIMLHLHEQDHQSDLYMVDASVTRPGIAEACALHPPNVSRSMRTLIRKGHVIGHTRSVRGESRRQKTWQLTDEGREAFKSRLERLRSAKVLLRDPEGELITVPAGEAADRLDARLSLLQILMHSQHEGVLTYGDIRFGAIERAGDDGDPAPGSLSLLAGAHSTYHVRPPSTRTVHGRASERASIEEWYNANVPTLVITGIAGTGKTTLVSDWLNARIDAQPSLRVMYYPCQPWDSPLGIATSLLHRLGIESKGKDSWDPHGLLSALPLKPGAPFDVDLFRRRLTAYLTDPMSLRERVFEDHEEASDQPPYILLVLDDVHHIGEEASHLLGALLQVAEVSPLRLLLVSRMTLGFYDRRDVHTRSRVEEMSLAGLSVEEISDWLDSFDAPSPPPADEVHAATGGHPLALELLELYGRVIHDDWLRFLDEEILAVLPEDLREILATLAVAERPIPWSMLAEASGVEGTPPAALIERGLLIEMDDGLWLHEAIKERLLREVGQVSDERRERLDAATDA